MAALGGIELFAQSGSPIVRGDLKVSIGSCCPLPCGSRGLCLILSAFVCGWLRELNKNSLKNIDRLYFIIYFYNFS